MERRLLPSTMNTLFDEIAKSFQQFNESKLWRYDRFCSRLSQLLRVQVNVVSLVDESCAAVTDDVLLSLLAVFDKILNNALELIETDSVTLLRLKNSPCVVDEVLLQVRHRSVAFSRCEHTRWIIMQTKTTHLPYRWLINKDPLTYCSIEWITVNVYSIVRKLFFQKLIPLANTSSLQI
jgi:hypothetical protein